MIDKFLPSGIEGEVITSLLPITDRKESSIHNRTGNLFYPNAAAGAQGEKSTD